MIWLLLLVAAAAAMVVPPHVAAGHPPVDGFALPQQARGAPANHDLRHFELIYGALQGINTVKDKHDPAAEVLRTLLAADVRFVDLVEAPQGCRPSEILRQPGTFDGLDDAVYRMADVLQDRTITCARLDCSAVAIAVEAYGEDRVQLVYINEHYSTPHGDHLVIEHWRLFLDAAGTLALRVERLARIYAFADYVPLPLSSWEAKK